MQKTKLRKYFKRVREEVEKKPEFRQSHIERKEPFTSFFCIPVHLGLLVGSAYWYSRMSYSGKNLSGGLIVFKCCLTRAVFCKSFKMKIEKEKFT